MDAREECRFLVGNIEAHALQIRLIEEQLATLRRMNPRARGVASGIACDVQRLASMRASMAAQQARLASLTPAKEAEVMAMTTSQYLTLVDRIGYTPMQAAIIRKQIEAGDASARFTLYAQALRKGLVKRESKPLSQGTIVHCSCGCAFNDASAFAVRLHAGH